MATGTALTYNLTVGVKLDVENMIFIQTPTDVPFLGTYNGTTNLPPSAGNNGMLSQDECFEKKVEWLEEGLLTPRTTLAATAVTADTYITLATGDQSKFGTGDAVLVDSEYMRITGYGTTTDTVTVTRALAGSAAQHVPGTGSNLTQVVGVGRMLAEGSDPSAARFKDRTNLYNYTQIFGPDAVTISGSEEAIAIKGGKYGVTSEYAHQGSNRLREQFVALEQAIAYGTRIEDTTNDWRSMGGLNYYISSNVDTTTTSINMSALLTQWQGSYDQGGKIDLLAVGAYQKRNMSFLDQSSVRLARTDTIRGSVVDAVATDYGVADVLLNRWVRRSNLIGLDKQWITVMNLRPFQMEVLAKTGDSMKAQIVGEKSLKVRMQARHFLFSGLT